MSSVSTRWASAVAALAAGQTEAAETEMRALIVEGAGTAEQAAVLARVVYNRAVAVVQSDRLDGLEVGERLVREAIGFAPSLPEPKQGLIKLLFRRIAMHEAAGAWPDAAVAAWEIATLSANPIADYGEAVAALAQRLEARARAMRGENGITAARLALGAWGLGGQGLLHYATARSLFVHLGTGEYGSAADTPILEAMLERDHRDLVALIGLANVRRRLHRLHTAELLCRAALGYWPENPFAMARLASILAEQGALESADTLFRNVGERFGGVEAAIRLSPSFVRGLEPVPATELRLDVPRNADYIVLAGGDTGYFHRYGDALVNSAARNARGCAVHFHIVEPDAEVEPRLQAMRERWPDMPIAATFEAVPASVPADLHKSFFACARFLQLPGLLAAYRKPILLLDLDMVMLRDPAPLLDRLKVEQADLALLHGGTRDPWCALWADTVLLAPTPRSMDYLAMVRNYIAYFIGQGKAVWFLDQIAMFAAFAAGFRDRPAPVALAWPEDVQNTRSDMAYFWSLHMSQPTNAAGPETEFYQRYSQNIF